MASCKQIDGLLQAYIDGELTAAEVVVLEQHVSGCRPCAAMLHRQKASSALLYESFAEHRLKRDITSSVMAHLPEMEITAQTGRDVTYRTKHPKKRMTAVFTYAPAWAAILLVALGLAIIYSWPSGKEQMVSHVGMVTYLRGEILRSDDLSTERRGVSLRSMIFENERLETAGNGALMIGLSGSSRLKADEKTRIKIMTARQINLETGRIWLEVGKDKRLFRVTTPYGTVTVFGTRFLVEVNNANAVVTVEDGEVTVENDTRFAVLNPNEQVELSADNAMLATRIVDTKALLGWADKIQPDPHAESILAATIKPERTGKIPAIQVFVVPTLNRTIRSITFEWKDDNKVVPYSGYYIYVSDDHMHPLFRGFISPEVFKEKGRSLFELKIPEDVTLSTVKILHIDVVPDHSSGPVETPFTEVFALSI